MKVIPESTVDGVCVPQRSTLKDPTEFTDSVKDDCCIGHKPATYYC